MAGEFFLRLRWKKKLFIFFFAFRSILTVPWIELGGSVAITCEKTGYHAKVEFMMKPFYGGKRHQICAEIFAPGEKKPFQTINGEWNGTMHVSYAKTGVIYYYQLLYSYKHVNFFNRDLNYLLT